MDKTQFWQLIETTYDDEAEFHDDNLKARLLELSAKQIEAFGEIYDEYTFATYNWDLWAVAYIIGSGCSDDCFSDFCSMVIRRGHEFYRAMLAEPETTALRHDIKEEDFDGMFSYGIAEAYQELTGNNLPPKKTVRPAEPKGKPWKEEELEELYPRLWKKFG